MTNEMLKYIDFKKVDVIFEDFNKFTGFVTAILDLEGNVLSKSGWRTICTQFHRVNSETCKNCLISDTILSEKNDDNSYKIYKCKNGLIDVSIPLIIDGEHVANIFTGQLFIEKPDIHFFEKQALKYGFDKTEYMNALSEVPVCSKEKVDSVVRYLISLTNIIVELTKAKMKEEKSKILFESSLNSPKDIIILSLDKNYNYLYFNQTHKNTMKNTYNAEVEVGKCIFDYMTIEEDIAKAKKNYGKALKGQALITRESYGDIELKTYETNYNPIYDNNDNIIGVSAYAKDISEIIEANKKLKKEKLTIQNYLDIAGVILLILNKHGEVTMINQKGCQILGLNIDQIIGKNWFDNFIPKGDINKLKKVFNDVLNNQSGLASHYESIIINSQGEERYISWNNTIIRDTDNNITGVLSSGEDITEIEISNKKLKESEKRYRELNNNLNAGVVVHNPDTSIMYFNKMAEELLGLKYDELMGSYASSSQFVFVDKNNKIMEIEEYPVNIIIKSKTLLKNYLVGVKHINKDKIVWLSVNGVPLFNEDRSIKEIVISFDDITLEKVRQDKIIYISEHDYLTDLFNRSYFVESYKEMDNPKYYPLGILMIDVNGLKIINDAYGHDVGDVILKKVSDILRQSCRENDIICRIGGDEFTVVLPNISEGEIELIRANISESSKKEIINNIELSLATGYEIKNLDFEGDLDDVLKLAENHMYRNKLVEGISVRNKAIIAILQTLTEKYEEEKIHSANVSYYCKKIGEALNINEEDVKDLELAGMYHDIGKISIPDAILKKPGKLSKEEFDTIKKHPEISYQILRAADEFSDLAIHALYHHERWDGTGYPSGKKGEEIPLFSRIICVADSYEAMTAVRSYKKQLTKDEAVKEIIKCSRFQFDEDIARVFVEKVLHKKWIT